MILDGYLMFTLGILIVIITRYVFERVIGYAVKLEYFLYAYPERRRVIQERKKKEEKERIALLNKVVVNSHHPYR